MITHCSVAPWERSWQLSSSRTPDNFHDVLPIPPNSNAIDHCQQWLCSHQFFSTTTQTRVSYGTDVELPNRQCPQDDRRWPAVFNQPGFPSLLQRSCQRATRASRLEPFDSELVRAKGPLSGPHVVSGSQTNRTLAVCRPTSCLLGTCIPWGYTLDRHGNEPRLEGGGQCSSGAPLRAIQLWPVITEPSFKTLPPPTKEATVRA